MKEVEGKVAVVTGAASGIGRGMAQVFADAGMKVVLSNIGEAALARDSVFLSAPPYPRGPKGLQTSIDRWFPEWPAA